MCETAVVLRSSLGDVSSSHLESSPVHAESPLAFSNQCPLSESNFSGFYQHFTSDCNLKLCPQNQLAQSTKKNPVGASVPLGKLDKHFSPHQGTRSVPSQLSISSTSSLSLSSCKATHPIANSLAQPQGNEEMLLHPQPGRA